MDVDTRAALLGWVSRSRSERTVSTAIFEGRTLVGELATTDPDTVVALIADIAALAGKAWSGRVALRDAAGAEVLSVPVRVDRAPMPATLAPSSEDRAAERDDRKALAEALRASTQHTHAMAALLIQTMKEYGQGAAAMMSVNERAMSSMAERLTRAEGERDRLDEMTRTALEAASEAQAAADKARKDASDVLMIARGVAGPKVEAMMRPILEAGVALAAAGSSDATTNNSEGLKQ